MDNLKQQMMILTCMQEVTGFASADVNLLSFSSVPPANVRTVTQDRSGALLYKPVPVHCALTIPQFDAKYPDLMTASLNKPQVQINKTVDSLVN
jgi:hypothetical protein